MIRLLAFGSTSRSSLSLLRWFSVEAKRSKTKVPTIISSSPPVKAKEEGQEAESEAILSSPPSTQKLKFYKPITPGLRHRVDIDRSDIYKGRPIPWLTEGLSKTGGRGHQGHICVRHRGGGHKRLYRFIDFKRKLFDVPAIVQRIEYDPNRSAYIALIEYQNKEKLLNYIVAPEGLQPGMKVISSQTKEVPLTPGNVMPLKMIPTGVKIHNLEFIPGKGAQIMRSAGCYAEIMDKGAKPGYVLVRLGSKEQRFFLERCLAVIGTVSNSFHHHVVLGKAGRSRHRGRRPHVRGVAMNPVDHPMGGGRGKTKGGRPSCSPTGVLAKGYKTRKRKLSPLTYVSRAAAKKIAEKD